MVMSMVGFLQLIPMLRSRVNKNMSIENLPEFPLQASKIILKMCHHLRAVLLDHGRSSSYRGMLKAFSHCRPMHLTKLIKTKRAQNDMNQ